MPAEASSCVLAIESATRVLSLALGRGEQVHEWTGDGKRAHSERLLPALQQLLESSDCSLDDVDLVALSIGPGSFTGLRTALACVKGLAFSGRPLVAAVSTLAGLAAGARASGPVAVLLGAGRGEVYAGAFARPGAASAELLPESVYRPEALAAALPGGLQLVAGEGAAQAARELCALRPDLPAPLPPPSGVARAAALLGIARGCAARPARELAPRYLRRAEAEARRTGQALEASD